MKKTTYILAVILILVLLAGAYFLMTSGFKSGLESPVKKVEAAESLTRHLEEKVNSLIANKNDTVAGGVDSADTIRRETETGRTQLQTEVAELKNRLIESEQARDKMAKMLEDKVREMTNVENALQEEIANSKKRETELDVRRVSLEGQVSKLTVELDETQKQFTSIEENPLKEPVREVRRLKRELLIQEKKLNRITDSYNRLKDELKNFAGIISKKDEALAAKEMEIESLKTQIGGLEKSQETFTEENDPQKVQADELKKRVEVILQSPK